MLFHHLSCPATVLQMVFLVFSHGWQGGYYSLDTGAVTFLDEK